MKLLELLSYYKNFGKITIVDTDGQTIDVGSNGNLIKSLFGNKKVVSFKAINADEISVTVEKE